MKIGQTSLIVFLSKLLGSALGFLGTLYFARRLGAEVLGIYSLVLTVVAWLIVVADLGVGVALVKRISESKDQGEYLAAGAILTIGLTAILSVAVVLGGSLIESYIAEFSEYVSVSIFWFILALIFTELLYRTTVRVLKGEQKVHLAGLLDPAKIGIQRIVQVILVVFGFSLLGMLIGAIVGSLIVGIAGLYWIRVRPKRPEKRHFRSLFDYAKFSWLGNLKARAFNEVDILLLGVFVPTSSVGVYTVAWSLAKFLDLFGTAISTTLFPELSYKSAKESKQAAAGLVEDSLSYTGLIAIPGFVGGTILADRLLRLYGSEFATGEAVLPLLILAILIFSYQKQLMGGLNGLNKPNLAFQINILFIFSNLILNIFLISLYGVEGAAVATVFSTTISLVFAYYILSQVISFNLPLGQLTRQLVAALVMGTFVFGTRVSIEYTNFIDNNVAILFLLVGFGSSIYFVVLLFISSDFRATVNRNLPIDLPLVD